MFYRDHGPPHFHASYGEYAITVTIRGFNSDRAISEKGVEFGDRVVQAARERVIGELGIGATAKTAQ